MIYIELKLKADIYIVIYIVIYGLWQIFMFPYYILILILYSYSLPQM